MNLKTQSGLKRIDVPFEIKQFDEEDDDFFSFEGFASTFGNLDLVQDIMLSGAFTESIEKELPVLLWQHSSGEPIGVTVKAQETDKGLFIRGHMPKSDDFVKGRVIPQMKIGSIKTMSIGFFIIESELDLEDPRIRRIAKVDLREISLVTFPANPLAVITDIKALSKILDKTEISDKDKKFLLQNLQENDGKQITVEDVKKITTQRNFEKALRDAGFSKSAAEMVASNKFNESLRGEPADDDIELTNALKAISSNLQEQKAISELSKISEKVNTHVRSINERDKIPE